jgi:CheY-like chemotaxis protein
MAGERVLVIEDDAEIRKVVVSLLTSAGYRVAAAEDGEAALLQVEARAPDLILLDMVMPGMSGWTFLRRLTERGSSIPVVVLSGRYASATPLGELSECVTAYIPKPFDRAQLVETCARVLAGNGPEAERERRAAVRQPLALGATLLAPDGRPTAVGRVLNLSSRGLAVELAVPLALGNVVEVAVGLPGQAEPLRVTAEVQWSAGGVSGLNFVGLSAVVRQRIEAFLFPRQ